MTMTGASTTFPYTSKQGINENIHILGGKQDVLWDREKSELHEHFDGNQMKIHVQNDINEGYHDNTCNQHSGLKHRT